MFVTVLLLVVTLCAQEGHGEEKVEAQRPGHVSVVVLGARVT